MTQNNRPAAARCVLDAVADAGGAEPAALVGEVPQS
ncbi:hypothetical protein SAMN05216188_12425 [Lentzea xinjiangensis]|uniref:Uncharacterized protein n=1 Tax=Lentzea xinjiangensis TaxID=402600 RepID=A0A1H9V4E1_9PSEU|nr:hypothetical protein SAMN05216188_12425 [Lentzea xinjiangensis]